MDLCPLPSTSNLNSSIAFLSFFFFFFAFFFFCLGFSFLAFIWTSYRRLLDLLRDSYGIVVGLLRERLRATRRRTSSNGRSCSSTLAAPSTSTTGRDPTESGKTSQSNYFELVCYHFPHSTVRFRALLPDSPFERESIVFAV